MDIINQQRKIIDDADKAILEQLALRFAAVDKIGKEKKKLGIPPLDETRWQEVLDSKKEIAKIIKLNPKMIEEIYNIIHKYALKLEK